MVAPSADGSKVYGAGPVLLDDQLNAWRLVQSNDNRGLIVEWQKVGTQYWVQAGFTSHVDCIQKYTTCYHHAPGSTAYSPSGWWEWDGNSSWFASDDPSAAPSPPKPNSGYHVANGQLLKPDGTLFKIKGVNVCSARVWGDKGWEHTRITRAKLQALYPNVNFIRYANWAGFLVDPAAADIMAWTKDFTDHGIVVMYDLHYTGDAISPSDNTANNWLAKCANTYKDNPLVFGQAQNEPHGYGGNISAMMHGQYQAWRSTGNKNPFMACCGNPGGELTGMNAADFRDMTNFVFDLHYYGWMPSNGMSYQSCVQQLANFRSADGPIPVACLEYGDSTDGNVIDGNWQTVCQQALDWPQGSAAWMVNWWDFTGTQGDSLVTNYNMSARSNPYGNYVNSKF